MYILNIASAREKMTVNELRDFTFENYYKRIGFVKESIYYLMTRLKRKNLLWLATKLIEKTPNLCNAKEHYQTYIRKKKTQNQENIPK